MENDDGNYRGGSGRGRSREHDNRINMTDQNKGIWRGRGDTSKQIK